MELTMWNTSLAVQYNPKGCRGMGKYDDDIL